MQTRAVATSETASPDHQRVDRQRVDRQRVDRQRVDQGADLPRADLHRFVTSLEGLAAIVEPGVNVCVFRRPLEPAVHAALEAVSRRDALHLHGVVQRGNGEAVDGLLAELGEGLARDFLRADIAALADAVATLAGTSRPRVGLETVVTDACRKWHCDFVGLRLLVTYVGPGTHWAPESAIDRRWLGSVDGDMDTVNARIVADAAQIPREHPVQVTQPGDILLLKGDAFPGNAGRGAVHRSPPLGASGTRRLVLKIDDVPCGC